jgi:hypothetical protein
VAEVKPYYEHAGITIYHGDCQEILPSVGPVDLVLSDPPYGIGWKPRVNHQDQTWIDDIQLDPSYLIAEGTEHVLWGANYYARRLPHSADWLAWERRHDADSKLKAAIVEHELGGDVHSPFGRARLDAVEHEKLDLYQQHYEEYIRIAKGLQALIRR